MRMPYLGNVKKKTQEQIIRFAGINYGEDGGDGDVQPFHKRISDIVAKDAETGADRV